MCSRISSLFFVSWLSVGTSGAFAGFFFETGDAGQDLDTAQVATGSGVLNGIVGTLPTDPVFFNPTIPPDVDLFQIMIDDPDAFSATTLNDGTSEIFDTQLYLFDANGLGVIANSNTSLSVFEFRSTIPPGSVDEAGEYFLGIALFGSRPIDEKGDYLFPDLSSSDEVEGPQSGSNALDDWDTVPLSDPSEHYRIDLTGAAFLDRTAVIPEPTSATVWVGCVLMVVGLCYQRRLRSVS